ncbi:MAG: DNA-formamidopyrimidine glycosylase family protein [Flavipsychrobacter sp.]|nr:DNA-formamidopyrimidine glycosylase family protein [Flavipsychrobacter sp.]
MPEGPSIVILKELTQQFTGKKIIGVSGNTKEDKDRLLNQKIIAIKSWGKHYLICFKDFTVRIHLMMFGSYAINEEKEGRESRLSLQFKNGSLNFYTCAVKFIEGDINDTYDWSADIMSPDWDTAKARKKLKAAPDLLVCDALLKQDIFAGSGNIIKCEVLWRVRLHPLNTVGNLPAPQLKQLINETHNYAFDFLEWKKEYTLRQHWQAYAKKICPRCNIPLVKEHLGKTNRRTFYCWNCQLIYE